MCDSKYVVFSYLEQEITAFLSFIVKRKNDLIIPYDVFFQWNLIEYLCDIKTIHKKVMPS